MPNLSTAAALISGAAVLLATSSLAQTPESIAGTWRAQDGSNTVVVSACTDGAGLCAVVTDERPVAGEPSTVGQVALRGLRPQRDGWTGRYVIGGENWAARVRMVSRGTVDFRVCPVAFVCETVRYLRIER